MLKVWILQISQQNNPKYQIPPAISSSSCCSTSRCPGEDTHTHTRPGIQVVTFSHRSVVRSWSTGVRGAPPTGPNNLWSTLSPDTFLSEQAWSSFAVRATVSWKKTHEHLSARTRRFKSLLLLWLKTSWRSHRSPLGANAALTGGNDLFFPVIAIAQHMERLCLPEAPRRHRFISRKTHISLEGVELHSSFCEWDVTWLQILSHCGLN